MKIPFKDGSFIDIDESDRDDKIVSITMCGLNKDGNKVTMSTSELDINQATELNNFLKEIIKKFT